MTNGSPCRPIRTCRKRTGPRDVSCHREGDADQHRRRSSTIAIRREQRGRAPPLTIRRTPENSGSSTFSSGSPATGRMWIRGPEMSVSRGATSRRHAGALEVPGQAAQVVLGDVGPRGHRHGVGADLSEHLEHMVAVAQDRNTLDAVAPGPVDADRYDLEPGVRFAPHRSDQLGHRPLETDDHDALHAAPLPRGARAGSDEPPSGRRARAAWPAAARRPRRRG